jgi:hypothetical protein
VERQALRVHHSELAEAPLLSLVVLRRVVEVLHRDKWLLSRLLGGHN